jgi:hypothetical protein
MIQRALLALCLAAFVVPGAARACSCSQGPLGSCPSMTKDDVIFLGTVTDVAVVPPPPGTNDPNQNAVIDPARITRYHFHIDEKFSAPDSPEIDVFSGGDDGDCGYRFKKGEKYIVFTEQGTEGRLFATICNGTRPVSEGTAILPQLRAMRDGRRVASVFGVLRRAEPPTLAVPDDPDDPLPNVALRLRSRYDRFTANTDKNGVFSFYDVHAGDYQFTADLPPTLQLSERTLTGPLPMFSIPSDACFEYNVDALPTGRIIGTVTDPDGKPLRLASLELFRAGTYNGARSGLWTFQGSKGVFQFDHVGPGEYIIVYNRGNRMNPNSPYPRTFYPGVESVNEAQPIEVKEGEQLEKVVFAVKNGFPTRTVRVHLNWKDGKPPGSVTVMAKADKGDNPSAEKISDGVYEFTLMKGAHYTISAFEDLDPSASAARVHRGGAPVSAQRAESGSGEAGSFAAARASSGGPDAAASTRAAGNGATDCAAPVRLTSDSIVVDASGDSTSEITLTFANPLCAPPQQ